MLRLENQFSPRLIMGLFSSRLAALWLSSNVLLTPRLAAEPLSSNSHACGIISALASRLRRSSRRAGHASARKSSREVHAVHEDILEIGMRGQGDVLDASRDALGAMALGLGEEGHLGSQGRGIADITDLRLGQGGDEPDAERAPD